VTNSTNATTSLLNDDQARPADYANAAYILHFICTVLYLKHFRLSGQVGKPQHREFVAAVKRAEWML